uniref:Uncharacterized protein n=1 Tax=Rhizophora mucronata TaxID=61149 RepID=A0A2P2R421_RHIMU
MNRCFHWMDLHFDS